MERRSEPEPSGGGKVIALVAPSFYPMLGGVELYVQGLGFELARLGYEVHVFTPDSVLGRRLEKKEELVDGVLVHRIHVPVDLSYRLKLWPGLRDSLMKLHPDIVHVYSHDTYSLLITTYGPFESHSDYGWFEAGLFRAYDAVVTPRLFKSCAAIMVRYPELLRWTESLNVPSGRVHVEPSGIPRSYLLKADGHGRFKEEIGQEGPLILYLGRVSPQKGVQYAVEALAGIAREYPDAKLVIIGPDYQGYSHYLKERARELGLSRNLLIFDSVRDERKEAEILSSCDVFVMPSSFEGFSQAVMKAMAQERPTVVTKVGGLPYEVEYGKCGLICDFGNAGMLAESVLRILSSDELSEGLGRRARVRAESFTFDKLAMNVADIYNTVLAESLTFSR
jgi:glycosyltransferase involved in cell wall biosynthesis